MLTDKDKGELYYLIHGKSHITNGDRVISIDNAILYEGVPNKKPLYRGISEKELIDILNGNPLNRYQSFTESCDIAKKFGPYIITLLPSVVHSFPLWQWGICDLCLMRLENPCHYKSSEGDDLLLLYAEEREWIIPYNTKLKCVDIDNLIFEIIL